MSGSLAPRLACSGLALLAALVVASPVQAVAITEFPVPTRGSSPGSIVSAGEALWYETGKPLVGRVDPHGGRVKEFRLPYEPYEIVAGADGRVWFTMFVNGGFEVPVAVFDPRTGQTRVFEDLTDPHWGANIARGDDGAIWALITDGGGFQLRRVWLVRIDPFTSATRTFEVPPQHRGGLCCGTSGVAGLTPGPDARLYFWSSSGAAPHRDTLVRFDPATGAFESFRAPEHLYAPLRGLPSERDFGLSVHGGAVGPDGRLWFTEASTIDLLDRVRVIRFDPSSGVWSELGVPGGWSESGRPQTIVAGPDGGMWLTRSGLSSTLVRIDPASGAVEQWPVPTAGRLLVGLTVGPDNNLWFTEFTEELTDREREADPGEDNVGRVDIDGAAPSVGNMDSVLGLGLSELVQCGGPCRATVDAVLLRRDGGPAVVAARGVRRARVSRARVRLRRAGTADVRLRFSRRARRQVRRAGRRAQLQVVAHVQGRRGRGRIVRRTVLLKRYSRR